MKKTLTILAFIILGTIVLALCSLFVRYGLDAFTFLGGVALAIITYLTTGVWSVGRIAVFGVLALAIAACVILLIKLIKKKKSFVTYLVLVDIFVIIGLAGVFFLPYPANTLTTVVSLMLNDFTTGATIIVRFSSLVFLVMSAITVLLALVFFILALIDIALTPQFVKHVEAAPEVMAAEVPQDMAIAPEQYVQPEVAPVAPEQYEQPVQPEPYVEPAPEVAPQPEYIEQPAPEAAPQPQYYEQPVAQAVAQPAPTLEEFRALIREELARNSSKVDVTVSYAALPPFMYPPVAPQPQPAPQTVPQPQQVGLTKEEVLSLIREENSKTPVVTKEDIRSIVAAELSHLSFTAHNEPRPAVEVKAAPVVQPVAVQPAPTPTPEPEIISIISEIDEEEAAKRVIIRVPFEERMQVAEQDLLDNYNELKNYILAYGVKSRVSNSGDTFRLHTETYVKITIAGKGLKLYYALDPKAYADSTIPVTDVSHKSIYVEIPACFKVKSVLSVKRAKQLIDDVMAKKGLIKGEVENVDYAKTFR